MQPDQSVESAASTPIDEAWIAARTAEREAEETVGDDIAARFIDVVLNEPLFCPVWDDEQGQEAGDAPDAGAGEDAIAPKMVEIEGVDTLLLFDTEERLAAYVAEPTSFVALPGRVFFELARDQGAQIALNLDVAPSSTMFAHETVDAVAELVEATEETLDVAGDQPLEVGAPDYASETLLSALSARLAAARKLVAEGWLFSVSYAGEGGRPMRHLVLGLRPERGADEDELRSLAVEIGRLGGIVLENESILDVAYLAEGERLLKLARRYGVGIDQVERKGGATSAA